MDFHKLQNFQSHFKLLFFYFTLIQKVVSKKITASVFTRRTEDENLNFYRLIARKTKKWMNVFGPDSLTSTAFERAFLRFLIIFLGREFSREKWCTPRAFMPTNNRSKSSHRFFSSFTLLARGRNKYETESMNVFIKAVDHEYMK